METKKQAKDKMKFRYKFLIVFILLISSLLLWSRYISTMGFNVNEYKVINNNLPVSFNGLKVVHISDIHYDRTIDNKKLNEIVTKINLIKPDIVIFSGDLIDKDIKLTDIMQNEIIASLKKIDALYGKYFISGNHDFDFSSYISIMESSGFINLNNNYDIITNNKYESIYIGGLESSNKGKPDVEKITSYFNIVSDTPTEEDLKKINIYKILTIHEPDIMLNVEKYDFNLVLAGHSHNGQIRLPFVGKLYTPTGAKTYYDTYYKINNTDFYVSNGLGTSTINFRLFNRPSFNFYRLVKEK